MAPSATVNVVEPQQHELKQIGTVAVEAVSPSPSTDDDHDLPKLERMPQTVRMSGQVNGFRTPETIDSLDSDDPVVIVGMGEWPLFSHRKLELAIITCFGLSVLQLVDCQEESRHLTISGICSFSRSRVSAKSPKSASTSMAITIRKVIEQEP